jgi:hypothetical protein
MEEHGVSKIVSVKFHKAGDTVTGTAPVSIETPVKGPRVEEEEDAPHKREETFDVSAITGTTTTESPRSRPNA